MNWETVDLTGAEMVRLQREAGPQKWWNAPLGMPVTATVQGPEVDVQLRLVHPSGSVDTLRYVIAITIDGQPADWRALTSMPDTSVRLDGILFGDRDRVRLPLGPGPHTIGVTLSAGHSDRMLVRIRQAVLRED